MSYKKVNELLKNKFHLEKKELKVIKDFSILWSIFETDFCNNNSSIQNVEMKILSISFNKMMFKNFYEYLKERYTNSSQSFESLEFRSNDRKDFVRECIYNKSFEEININELIIALYIIVYRFRNNFFHGHKAKYNFYDQYNNFRLANVFLLNLINSISN